MLCGCTQFDLHLPAIGCVMLFRYRGSAPLQRAILNQDQTTGVTVQLLDPNEFDAGKILAQAEVVSPWTPYHQILIRIRFAIDK